MIQKILSNYKKYERFFQFALLLLFLYFIWVYAVSTNTNEFKQSFFNKISVVDRTYQNHPEIIYASLIGLHLVVSFFSIPACTLLNIGAGYLFGFWTGSLLIYSVTMFSAVLGYFAGLYLNRNKREKWNWRELPEVIKQQLPNGLLYLILLRLTPFLPFGILNLSLGYSKIPFSNFFLSTFVGIFFDVVLLNRIGASIRDLENTTFSEFLLMTGFFATLLLLVMFIFSKKFSGNMLKVAR